MESILNQYISWWLDDFPPMDGQLRFLFYVGLLLLCIFDRPSPLHATSIIGRTERVFYTPAGLMRMFGFRWISVKRLRLVTGLTIVFWILAATGLAQPFSAIMTFLGFAFLHGVNAGALGSNHSTHVALYVLFCMCFSVSYDVWSVDYYLVNTLNWQFMDLGDTVLATGFARKLALVFIVFCMFAGGISKLANCGLKWLNGNAIRFYVTESLDFARWPWLARQISRQRWLCVVLAFFTVVVELGAIVALWSPTWRVPIILAWAGFHLGILAVMMPAYWIQMWCYIVIVDWRSLFSVAAEANSGDSIVAANLSSANGSLDSVLICAVGSCVCISLITVLVKQAEWWPLTSVAMYSNCGPPCRRPKRIELKICADKAHRGNANAWMRAWMPSECWEEIQLRDQQDRPKSLFWLLDEQSDMKSVRWSQFSQLVRKVAIADLAAKSPEHIEYEPNGIEYPGTAFLRRVVPVIKNGPSDWKQYKSVVLVCLSQDGPVVISRVDLKGE